MLKWLLLIVVALLLLALLRRFSRPVDASRLEPTRLPLPPTVLPARAQEAARLVLRKSYFREIDTATGPADPERFYDELFIEFEDVNTGESWTSSYFVGTPKGIEQIMAEEGWDEMFGAGLLIVRRFDIQLIRDAILQHLEEQHEIAPGLPRDPHLG